MEAISFVNYTFAYAGADAPALSDVSLGIDPGEMVLLCGATGSGKTTLLRSVKPELAPVGRASGSILIDGEPRGTAGRSAGRIGFVGQNPENQIVTDTVEGELAFGLENLALPSDVIRRRMAEVASFFGIEDWMQRKTAALSGGQKQLLNLAAVLVMQPEILLLDEPTSQLDPVASKSFLQMLGRISGELGITVILSEHRMEDALPMADRVIWMEHGRVGAFCTPQEFVRTIFHSGSSFAASLPSPARAACRLGERSDFPLDVRAGRAWLAQNRIEPQLLTAEKEKKRGETAISANSVWYRYDWESDFAVRNATLAVQKGTIHAVVGGNGSGKSTLLRLLCGTLKPARGKVKTAEGLRLSLLAQNPRALFTSDTVRSELCELQELFGYSDGDADGMLERFGLAALAEHHPYDLSGGEMQKTAIAKLLLLQPDILLLDEPTKGIDAAAKNELAKLFFTLREEGKTILLVTHDVEFAALCADRCSMLFEGSVVCSGEGHDFFASNLFYTTGVNRMMRSAAPGCVTVEDLAEKERPE